MAKKAPAKRAPAKRKPRPKKPVPADSPFEFSEYSPEAMRQLREILDAKSAPITIPPQSEEIATPVMFPPWLTGWLKAVALLVLGVAGGIWSAGGIPIGPDGGGKQDDVSEVFDTQEAAFRRLSPERAKLLRDGTLTSEKASADWMAEKYLPESDAAWAKLLTSEAEAFGGEQWTAEKEAAHIERYAR